MVFGGTVTARSAHSVTALVPQQTPKRIREIMRATKPLEKDIVRYTKIRAVKAAIRTFLLPSLSAILPAGSLLKALAKPTMEKRRAAWDSVNPMLTA